MTKQYSDDVLDFINELQKEKAAADEARAQGKKKARKEKLNVLFAKSVPSRVKAIFSSKMCPEGMTESDVARTAMNLGLLQMEEAIKNKDDRRIIGWMHMVRLREMFNK